MFIMPPRVCFIKYSKNQLCFDVYATGHAQRHLLKKPGCILRRAWKPSLDLATSCGLKTKYAFLNNAKRVRRYESVQVVVSAKRQQRPVCHMFSSVSTRERAAGPFHLSELQIIRISIGNPAKPQFWFILWQNPVLVIYGSFWSKSTFC